MLCFHNLYTLRQNQESWGAMGVKKRYRCSLLYFGTWRHIHASSLSSRTHMSATRTRTEVWLYLNRKDDAIVTVVTVAKLQCHPSWERNPICKKIFDDAARRYFTAMSKYLTAYVPTVAIAATELKRSSHEGTLNSFRPCKRQRHFIV